MQVAGNFTCMMQANLPAICRWIYPRCDSRLPVIAGNSVWNCRFFACDCAGTFSCVCSHFSCVGGYLYLRFFCFCLQFAYIFAWKSRQFCMLVAGKFAWVPHVNLPVKCMLHSSKFTCACTQFACILREVLAAWTQLNLPVFTGKLHVTQVNCVWGLFTCGLQVKLPAFADNFARASFTV